MPRCQNCEHLEKLPYSQAYPTHHENWRCKLHHWTLAYHFTTAEINCAGYKEIATSQKLM